MLTSVLHDKRYLLWKHVAQNNLVFIVNHPQSLLTVISYISYLDMNSFSVCNRSSSDREREPHRNEREREREREYHIETEFLVTNKH